MSATILDNPAILAIVVLITTLYASNASMNLPPRVMGLFEKPLFRVVYVALLVYMINKNITITLILSMLYILVDEKLFEIKIGTKEHGTFLSYPNSSAKIFSVIFQNLPCFLAITNDGILKFF